MIKRYSRLRVRHSDLPDILPNQTLLVTDNFGEDTIIVQVEKKTKPLVNYQLERLTLQWILQHCMVVEKWM